MEMDVVQYFTYTKLRSLIHYMILGSFLPWQLTISPGLQMAFIDGNQTERLCEPMKQYIEARGGQVLTNQPLASYLDAVAGDTRRVVEI